MKKKKRLLFSLLINLLSLSLWAQGAHWQCNPGAFGSHEDMTVYLYLELDDVRITDLSNYDIAAFCGDECRGFVDVNNDEIMDTPAGQIAILRVHTNNPSAGDIITFKVYDKAEQKEINVANTKITFTTDTQGSPSSPFKLDITQRYTLGDVNGDGKVTNSDVIALVRRVLNIGSTTIIEAAGDMNNDGKISNADVIALVRKVLNIL